jgi:ribosomal protein S18 acetylase RimI-like enzyme
MFNSGDKLFTCAAIYHHHDGVDEHSSDDDDRLPSLSDCSIGKYSGCIVTCIVGSFVHVSRLDASTVNMLISDTSRYSRLFYIMTLGTAAEFRNIRLATTLIQDVNRMVELDATCGALYLHVITFNDAAIRFYERLGFYRVTEIESKNDTKLAVYSVDSG